MKDFILEPYHIDIALTWGVCMLFHFNTLLLSDIADIQVPIHCSMGHLL